MDEQIVVKVNPGEKTTKFINIKGKRLKAVVVSTNSQSLLSTTSVSQPLSQLTTQTIRTRREQPRVSTDKSASPYRIVDFQNPPQMAYKKNRIKDIHTLAYTSSIVEVPEVDKRRLLVAQRMRREVVRSSLMVVPRIKSIQHGTEYHPVERRERIVVRPPSVIQAGNRSETVCFSIGTLTDDILKGEVGTQTIRRVCDKQCQTDDNSESRNSISVAKPKKPVVAGPEPSDPLSDLNMTDLIAFLDNDIQCALINEIQDPATETIEDDLKKKLALDLKNALVEDAQGNYPIHNSVLKNDYKLVRRHCLIVRAKQVSVNLRNGSNFTPLQLAIFNNSDVRVVKTLLLYGGDLGTIDENGRNIIHLAVEEGNIEILEVLLFHAKKLKFNLNMYDFDGMTPLLISANARQDVLVKLLITYGADVNCRDQKSGRTALFYATENCDEKMVDLLLFYKANTKLKNFFGTSPHDAVHELNEIPPKIKNLILKRSGKRKKDPEEEDVLYKPKTKSPRKTRNSVKT